MNKKSVWMAVLLATCILFGWFFWRNENDVKMMKMIDDAAKPDTDLRDQTIPTE